MKLGERMLRLEDGQRGVVAQNGPELRIVYQDRGEERVASKTEKWVTDELKVGPLRAEEMAVVGWYADRALRALERHEPMKMWETPDLEALPYDAPLVFAIAEYLRARQTRPASN